jgi:hypothetical protein
MILRYLTKAIPFFLFPFSSKHVPRIDSSITPDEVKVLHAAYIKGFSLLPHPSADTAGRQYTLKMCIVLLLIVRSYPIYSVSMSNPNHPI